MNLYALDPGTFKTGIVCLTDGKVVWADVLKNIDVEQYLLECPLGDGERCVIEMIAGYGMPVGKETFETCVWIGRFMAAFGVSRCDRLFRKDIKIHLCGTTKAKDPNVWQAIVDRYGPGKERAIGNKKQPGPLYKINSHQRAALAVGLCWLDGVRSDCDLVEEIKEEQPA